MGHRTSRFDPHNHGQSANRRQPSVSVHLSPPGSCVGVLDSSTLLLGAHLIGGPVSTTLMVTTTSPRLYDRPSWAAMGTRRRAEDAGYRWWTTECSHRKSRAHQRACLLYTSDAADEEDSVD